MLSTLPHIFFHHLSTPPWQLHAACRPPTPAPPPQALAATNTQLLRKMQALEEDVRSGRAKLLGLRREHEDSRQQLLRATHRLRGLEGDLQLAVQCSADPKRLKEVVWGVASKHGLAVVRLEGFSSSFLHGVCACMTGLAVKMVRVLRCFFLCGGRYDTTCALVVFKPVLTQLPSQSVEGSAADAAGAEVERLQAQAARLQQEKCVNAGPMLSVDYVLTIPTGSSWKQQLPS